MSAQDREHSHHHHQMYEHYHMQHENEPTLLDLQAADYFKLDPAQVNMLNNDMNNKFTKKPTIHNNGLSRKHRKYIDNKQVILPTTTTSHVLNVPNSRSSIKREILTPIEQSFKENSSISNQHKGNKQDGYGFNQRNDCQSVLASSATYLVGSSTTSTNSLPSISSSPSVSPSLMCPHLTLNDILMKQKDASKSPNTIGLCAKCRLDPPPNVQSPLSPLYDPMQSLRRQSTSKQNNTNYNKNMFKAKDQSINNKQTPLIKRGYSDHQIGSYSRGSGCSLTTATSNKQQQQKRSQLLMKTRQDDSLDYYLEPNELKRLQLSPTLRHSVGFIRKNPTETGRVLKIYKNGLPYDKPLRICIMRGEFSTLNHLLDYINSRQLVPSGARYLFHLDGSLVYSVNELKHAHIYVVSGTRVFDYRSNKLLKEKNDKELEKNCNRNIEIITNQGESMVHELNQQKIFIQFNNNNYDRSKFKSIRQENNKNFKSNEPLRIRSKSNLSSSNIYSSNKSLIGSEQSNSRQIVDQVDYNTLDKNKKSLPASEVRKSVGSPQKNRKTSPKHVAPTRPTPNNLFTSQNDLLSQDIGGNDSYYYPLMDNDEEKPIELTRAKSELSAIPMKRKKNVTFVDFAEHSSPIRNNSSPTINVSKTMIQRSSRHSSLSSSNLDDENDQNQIDSRKLNIRDKKQNDDIISTNSSLRALQTNEIGIQVSESIDGFLIDLPLPLPLKGDERKSFLRKGAGSKAYLGRISNKRYTESSKSASQFSMQRGKLDGRNRKQKAQVVTITERQLSTNELDKFRDLDHGDHHRDESHKVSVGTTTTTSVVDEKNQQRDEDEDNVVTISVNDPNETITIGSEPDQPSKKKSDLNNQKSRGNELKNQIKQKNHSGPQNQKEEIRDKSNKTNWQYPANSDGATNRIASATPTERPVSQNEANDMVHARVITPTPSLSTAGETNSLTLSYEMSTLNLINRHNNASSSNGIELMKSKLPERDSVPVVGRLVSGTNPTSKNFRLIWVNGFSINDRYPENSVNIFTTSTNTDKTTFLEQTNPNSNSLLSPTANNTNKKTNQHVQFKASERFNNWVCHSKKHYELIYPAGSLIVLWCRFTNEQRFYSSHTSSVSCVTLASLDLDLAASAQIEDAKEGINASIHLWSLKSLETLKIIDENLFYNQLIFSLKVKNNTTDGCELCISTRDDKRLWLYVIYTKLQEEIAKTDDVLQEKSERKLSTISVKRDSIIPKNKIVMKVNKLLQGNQQPLLVIKMSNSKRVFDEKLIINEQSKEQFASPSKQTINKQQQQHSLDDDEVIISFGRRHFQLWFADKKQTKLMLIKLANKNQQFINSMLKANCLVRMSPKEFLIGDMDGNINLIDINFIPPPKSLVANSIESQKYNIEIMNLFNHQKSTKLPSLENQKATSPTTTTTTTTTTLPEPTKLPSITCISRITGSLFVSSDSNCVVKFWKINRKLGNTNGEELTNDNKAKNTSIEQETSCQQLSSINLPQDLGFICTIIVSDFNRKQSIVELYIISTTNVILFGSIQLPQQSTINSKNFNNKKKTDNNKSEDIKEQMLANSYLFVVYEGHETSVMNLVSDVPKASELLVKKQAPSSTSVDNYLNKYYFTCSIDCKICKWNGKNLIWKSMLPSACASLAVHPIGSVLAVGSGDGTVYILDKTSGLLISYFPLTPVCINCLAYSIDGTLLAAGCANGSIFVLPVYDRGLKYKKVSIFQSPYPVVSLQFSINNQYILTSVTHGSYQELILWDLPNFRYMRDNVKLAADRIEWFDSICSGSEDVRAIWENANLTISNSLLKVQQQTNKSQQAGKSITSNNRLLYDRDQRSPKRTRRSSGDAQQLASNRNFIVNLSCHRLLRSKSNDSQGKEDFVIASDTRGYLRLFRYPCYDIDQAFFEIKISSLPVNCCRFLAHKPNSNEEPVFVSSSIDGSICIWALY